MDEFVIFIIFFAFLNSGFYAPGMPVNVCFQIFPTIFPSSSKNFITYSFSYKTKTHLPPVKHMHFKMFCFTQNNYKVSILIHQNIIRNLLNLISFIINSDYFFWISTPLGNFPSPIFDLSSFLFSANFH